ncbi:PREDICTED: regulator of microtubule dynamics protein 1 [Ficedula albicollis]|uniref:regulator of microtubule dynamics protein 1 n=1 Tax=Ficedula albicollis TaxID=59894 RepID=UPI000359592B|nr:PREDICTED: regulator of microtubule dynamics protein 1 [Ficedula albicollis]
MKVKVKRFHTLEVFPSGRVSYDNVIIIQASSPRGKDAPRSGVHTAAGVGTTDASLPAYSCNFTQLRYLRPGGRGSDSSIPAESSGSVSRRRKRGRTCGDTPGEEGLGQSPPEPGPAAPAPHGSHRTGQRGQELTPRGRGGPERGGPRGRGWPGSQVLRKSLQRGVVLSAGSFLVYEAHKLISGFAEVHASFKVEDVIEQADYLYGSGETEKLYRLLVQHKNSDDAELLWRLARSSRDLAQLGSTSAEEKKQLTYDSLEYAKKALEKNESNSAAHKWYGICLSDVGDYEGIKTKIGNAIIIKEHFQRAIELNPKDATTIHLIGIWCYSFAEMPWYQRKIAATLFATPPTSTFQEALRYFHMAEEADPNFYSKNLLFLGKTYLKLNNKKMALLWLSKAKEYPAQTEEDKQVQKEAVELLNSI